MKTINIIKTIGLLAAGAFFGACNDADYQTKSNSVYIADAASSEKSAYVTMEQSGADVTVTVRLAKPVDHDVEVSISIDAKALEDYNKANGSTYYPVAVGDTDLGGDAKGIIKAGEISFVSKIHIQNFETDNKLFALPLRVTSLDKRIDSSVSQGKFIYIIAKKLFQYVPNIRYMNTNGSIKAKPLADEGGWDLSLSEFTIECWCRFNYYDKNNEAIFSVYGTDTGTGNYEIYVRFGDANRFTDTGNGRYNYIQWKAWGVQLQGTNELVGNQWYHWAFQYDGTNMIIYRDGEEYLRGNASHPGELWHVNTFDMISCHESYKDICNLAQVRFWSRALTPAQIRNNMHYEVDPQSPGLIAYWKMDEGPDNFNNIMEDATGNGHDAVVPATGIFYNPAWLGPMGFDE